MTVAAGGAVRATCSNIKSAVWCTGSQLLDINFLGKARRVCEGCIPLAEAL